MVIKGGDFALKRFAFALILLMLVLISDSSFAWTISGNSVVEEDAQSRITVTPHTATSPVSNFSQEFELCNKTGTVATVYAAYLFNYALKAGKVEDWLPAEYNWVSKQYICDYNFAYKLNVDTDRNPHWAKCYKVTDANGYDENIVLFEREFKTGNLPTKTVTYDVNTQVSNAHWRDVTSYFTTNKTTIGGKHIYPYIDGFNLTANSCKKWRINYSPAVNDKTKKWELWLWSGASWNCILNDTCIKVLKLDPWWNTSWSFKRAINLPAQNIPRNTRIQVPIDFTSFTSVLANLDDVRIVDENNNVELADGVCEKDSTSTDGNCFFTMPYEMDSADPDIDVTYYAYYGNGAATAPTFGDTADVNTCSFESWQECGLKTDIADRNSDVFKFGATSAEISLWSLDRVEANGLGSRSSDLNYSTWFYLDNVTVAGGILFDMRSGGGNDLCQMGINSDLDVGIYSHTFTYSAIGTLALHNWYQSQIHYTDSDANCQYSIYNSTGGLVASANFDTKDGVPAVTDYLLIQGYNANDRMLIDQFYSGAPLLATGLAAEEPLSAPSIDVNVNSIEGHLFSGVLPTFNYGLDGNLTIGFSVYNSDNNAMKVDINYSTSAVKGTGVVVVNDLNLNNGICPNAQNWNVNSGICNWDFNISGIADGNYYILIDLNGSVSTQFEASSKSFKIIAPTLSLKVMDENYGFPLITPIVVFNGVNYSLNESGKISINTAAFNGQYVVSIGQDGNYPTRYFTFDLNSTSRLDLNVFLLQDSNGMNVGFKFYDTDETTILSNKLVRLRHGDSNICSMRYTDASGETSFFLDPDDYYFFEIVKSGSDMITYYPVILTISIPKDESTLANIMPFDAKGSQLAQLNWFNKSAAITYSILGNTIDYYSFDFNASNYNSRNYLVSVKGDTATYTLQAYLAAITSGPETISGNYAFVVTDSISINPIANVLIKVKKQISGVGEVEIASLTTDSAGQATTSLAYYVEYNIYCYYGGSLVFTAKITPTPTPAYYQIQLAISTAHPAVPVIGVLSISFKPLNHNIFLDINGLGDININVWLLNKDISTMKITLKDSNNLIISERYFTAPWTDGNLVHFDLNLLNFNRDRVLIAIVDVNSTDGNSYRADFGWSVFIVGQWEIMSLLKDFTSDNGKMALAFIALFITLLAVGAACMTSLVPGDPLLLSIMTVFILFFFVFIGFLDFIVVFFIALFVIFLAILTKAVM